MKTMIVNLSVICVLMCSATAFAANTHSNFSAELARVQTLDRLGDSNRALHLSDQLVLKYPKTPKPGLKPLRSSGTLASGQKPRLILSKLVDWTLTWPMPQRQT